MEFNLFFGRFHPLIVHLPIGFLMVAGLLELYARVGKNQEGFKQPIKAVLMLGVLASIVSVLSGLGLASSGGFNPGILGVHKWLGISVLLVSSVSFVLKAGFFSLHPKDYVISLLILMALVIGTGHYGGVLTHGDEYLFTYAPGFVKNMMGIDTEKGAQHNFPENPDSLLVFNHLINPIIKKNCVSCHDSEEMEGGLDLSSIEGIKAGGENGEVIMSGNALESEMIKRLLLPGTSRKVMPPNGDPLTYKEIRLLVWWINSGSDFEGRYTKMTPPEEINSILLTDYQYDPRPRPYWEILKMQALDTSIIQSIEQEGFKVSELGENNFLLDIEATDSISLDKMDKLLSAKDHVTWLKMSNIKLTDKHLAVIAQLKNLTKLNISLNAISNDGVKYLEGLSHLVSLNLYGTSVTDEAMESLEKIKSLKNVYLWQTGVTGQGAELLRSAIEGLEVDMGQTLIVENINKEEQ